MSDDALATPIPLSGVDAQVLALLAQIVAIGKNRGTWDAATVQRVAEAHLEHPHALRRQLMNERVRADRAEADNELLRAKVQRLRAKKPEPPPVGTTPWTPPTAEGKPRIVELPPRLAAALDIIATGAPNHVVATRLGMTTPSVARVVGEIVRAFGVKTRIEAVVLVHTKQVEVRVLEERRSA